MRQMYRKARRPVRCFEKLEARTLLSITVQSEVAPLVAQTPATNPLLQQAAYLSLPALTSTLRGAGLTNPQVAGVSAAPFPLAPLTSAAATSANRATLGAAPGATYQSIYSTGFEASEGYAQGFLGVQNGWSTFSLPLNGGPEVAVAYEPSIASGYAASGTQQLRLANNPDLGFGEYLVGAISPALPAVSQGCYSVSMDIALDNQGAQGYTSWFVATLAEAEGLNSPINSWIFFRYDGAILVYGNVGSTFQWVLSDQTWADPNWIEPRGAYQKLTLNVDPNNGQIQYFLDDKQIFQGALWGAPIIRQMLFYDADTGWLPTGSDIDNLSVTQTLLMPARAQAWWDDRVIVSSHTGDNFDSVLYPDDTLYVDWAVQNVGAAATAQAFSTQLYVDGALRQTWTVPAGVGSWNCYSVEDFSLGTLGVGRHTLRLVPDSGGAAGANNGLDGTYTKTITVEPWCEISGTKWDDLNANNVRDLNEPGVAGVEVYVDLDHNGQWDAGEPTYLTDADGAYHFTGLSAGTYMVSEMTASGSAPAPVPTDPPVRGSTTPLQVADLPTSFDLRNVDGANYVTAVRDQGMLGNCWGFATYGALESSILMEGGPTRDFSENHQKNYNGFDLWAVQGGNYDISQAYLSRGAGPVNESDDPYHDWDDVPSPGGTPDYYVRESTVFDTPAEIKAALVAYGALFADLYWDSNFRTTGSYDWLNEPYKYTYYCSTKSQSNHAVTIVGWDDTKVTHAAQPGAWLIKNSWGTVVDDGAATPHTFFDQGYFWMSYDDPSFCQWGAVAFRDAVPAANFDHIYTYDEHGAVNYLSVADAANAFTPQVNENLKAVQFYTAADGASYNVEIYTAFDGDTFSGLLASVQGTATYRGYHTVDLAAPVPLVAGQTFYVRVQLTGGGAYPMAFDCAQPGYSSTSRAVPGQSFCFDTDVNAWVDLTSVVDPLGQIDYRTANFCIKALASDVVLPSANSVVLAPGQQTGGLDFTSAPRHDELTLASTMIDENVSAGAAVGKLSALFTGSTGAVTYALVSGSGDVDNDAFAVVGDQLQAATPFDFEARSLYSVRVRATDANEDWIESPFTIRVLDVNEAPTLAIAPAASPDTVVGLNTVVSVLGADDHGEGSLVYRWSAIGPAQVAWSDNDSNTAKNAIATFQAAGNYVFTVTILDGEGLAVASSLNVTVVQTLSALGISPDSANLMGGVTQQFTAAAVDQFAQPMAVPSDLLWTASAGTIDSTGLFTAPLADGLVIVGVSGGGFSASAPVNVTTLPKILAWQSVVTHTSGVGAVGLTIPDDGKFTEPRFAGVNKLLVYFDEALAPASFTASAVQIAGNNVNGVALNLSGIAIAASLSGDGLVGQIVFTPALPNQARYLVRLVGLTDVAGNALTGDNDRVLTSLKGDANGDQRVNVTDLSYIQAGYANPINRLTLKQVRSDVNGDGRVNATDLSAAWAQRNADLRSVPVPTLPAATLDLPAENSAPTVTTATAGATTVVPQLLTAAEVARRTAAPTLAIDWATAEATAVDEVLATWS